MSERVSRGVKKWSFLGHFGFFNCAEIPNFIVLCEHQPKVAKKRAKKKTITFHILQNTGSLNKCCNSRLES